MNWICTQKTVTSCTRGSYRMGTSCLWTSRINLFPRRCSWKCWPINAICLNTAIWSFFRVLTHLRRTFCETNVYESSKKPVPTQILSKSSNGNVYQNLCEKIFPNASLHLVCLQRSLLDMKFFREVTNRHKKIKLNNYSSRWFPILMASSITSRNWINSNSRKVEVWTFLQNANE